MKNSILRINLSVILLVITVVSFSQETGWRGPGYSSATATNDAVFITGIRGNKDVLTAFTQDGKKKWDVEYGNISQAQNHPESRCTPTFANGKKVIITLTPTWIIGVNAADGHDNNSMGRWICVDWTTGKTMWTTNWYNKGSIISADGLLYLYEERSGYVALAKTNSQKLEIVSEFQIKKGTGPFWAHPVIDKGRLFIRHGDYLAVYSLKQE
jgi:hypothetical protein